MLYHHDCVIVPDFGGFVARNAASRLLHGGTLLMPPSKSVLFNPNLRNNDGLLAAAIMETEKISYAEANAKLAQYTQRIKQQLASLKRFEITGLGILFQGDDQVIRFEPDTEVNFLIQSFGLPAIQARPLETVEREAPKFEIRTLEQDKASNSSRKSFIRKRITAVAITIPVLALLVFISVKSIQTQGQYFANLNPFSSKVASGRKYVPATVSPSVNLSFEKIEQVELIPDNNGTAHLHLPEMEGRTIVVLPPDTASSDKTSVMVTRKTLTKPSNGGITFFGPYQVVVGCFSVQENAERLVHSLLERNIQAGISGRNAKGLLVVSVGGYKSSEEARMRLSEIRHDFPNAWLMNASGN